MFRFQRLDVWQKSIDFTKIILGITDRIPQRYQFSLGEQLRRAVISISTNIAEGSGRKSPKEARNFYNIAKGSVYEVVSLLTILFRFKIIDDSKIDKERIYEDAEEIARMLTGLIRKQCKK